MPTIVLGQDEVDCFAAWVSIEAGLPEHAEPGTDLKVRIFPEGCFLGSNLLSIPD